MDVLTISQMRCVKLTPELVALPADSLALAVFAPFPSPSLEASADEDNDASDDEDNASSSGVDKMTTFW